LACLLFREEIKDAHQEFLVAKSIFNDTYTNRANVHNTDCVIGRYSVLPFYKELEEDLKINGSSLINTFKQHDSADHPHTLLVKENMGKE
jgi:hypothetical protein